MKYLFINFLLFLSFKGYTQQAATAPATVSDAFAREIESYIDHSVPTITVQEAYNEKEKYLFLDAREPQEYKISHIENARYIGYKKFKKKSVVDLPRDTPIVIYCSIGYRSEKVGRKLLKMGFKNIQNLYGSIFEWANQGLPVVNEQGKTHQIHTYNKRWSQWLSNEDYQRFISVKY